VPSQVALQPSSVRFARLAQQPPDSLLNQVLMIGVQGTGEGVRLIERNAFSSRSN